MIELTAAQLWFIVHLPSFYPVSAEEAQKEFDHQERDEEERDRWLRVAELVNSHYKHDADRRHD